MSFHIYSVRRDENRHTCICVAVERKFTYFIPMEASEVKVRRMENQEFAASYEVVPEYPVRRAAEIFLRAPGKEVSDEARGHLEAVLSDPAYAYDEAQFSSIPSNLNKDLDTMVKKAAQVAEQVAAKTPRGRKVVAESEVTGTIPPRKTAKAPAEAKPKTTGRAPAMDPETRIKVGDTASVKRGFMAEFVAKAQELEKASRGRGFTIASIVESLTTEEHAASWVRTYVTYALDAKRGILVVA
jgi:hypothetical protein